MDKHRLTQVGRAMKELGVQMIRGLFAAGARAGRSAALGHGSVSAGIKYPQYCRFPPSGLDATWARTR